MELMLVVLALVASSHPGDPAPPQAPDPTLVEVTRSDRLWTGVAVSKAGRIFVNYPRWAPTVAVSVAEIGKDGRATPFPDASWNAWDLQSPAGDRFVCVQSVFVDDRDVLWVLDTGVDVRQGPLPQATRLIEVDLGIDRVVRAIEIGSDAAPPGSYLNDVRVDTASATAYVTDSGLGAILVIDLHSGRARRLLAEHPSCKAEDTILTIEGK